MLLCSGCCTAQSRTMEQNEVNQLMIQAAALSGRHVESVPPVYIIESWAMFKRIACMQYGAACGLGVANAIYSPLDQIILINYSVLSEPLNDVLIHELVHHLQNRQHDRRDCLDREAEAYRTQQLYSHVQMDVYERAVGSCTI